MTEINEIGLTMKTLEEHANYCIDNEIELSVVIDMPGFESPEIITNPTENIQKKIEYYKSTYDENCKHKHAKGIRIVAFAI